MWAQFRQTALMVTHDITESVLLADRVLVLSRRPGRLLADIAVTLPRPRHLEQVYEPGFVALAREVREAINRAI
jgi:NitT/TauT family transport system ATP-binding protein